MHVKYCLPIVFALFSLITGCGVNYTNLQEGIGSFKAQDYRQAFIHLLPEAKKGVPDAEYAVGYMYYYGQGVLEDRKQALYWINRAAAAGQREAIEALKVLR